MGEFIGLIAILSVFGIPLSAIWTSHRREVLKMQLQMQNQGDSSLRASVEALREEVKSLRDTTLQYDLSFDNALQRMEQRVDGLERRVNEVSNDNIATISRGN